MPPRLNAIGVIVGLMRAAEMGLQPIEDGVIGLVEAIDQALQRRSEMLGAGVIGFDPVEGVVQDICHAGVEALERGRPATRWSPVCPAEAWSKSGASAATE